MSKNVSYFPRNYLRQPHIKELVPDLKLTLVALGIECESAIGCWIPGALDDAVNIKHLSGALDDLERRSLISVDKKTGEVFWTEFFRYNHFSGAKRVGQARDAFAMVRSDRLRIEIREQVRLNQRFCKLLESDLDPLPPTPEKSDKTSGSVDNLIKDVKNQFDTNQGKGEGEGKLKKQQLRNYGGGNSEATPLPPADDAEATVSQNQQGDKCLKAFLLHAKSPELMNAENLDKLRKILEAASLEQATWAGAVVAKALAAGKINEGVVFYAIGMAQKAAAGSVVKPSSLIQAEGKAKINALRAAQAKLAGRLFFIERDDVLFKVSTDGALAGKSKGSQFLGNVTVDEGFVTAVAEGRLREIESPAINKAA